MNGLWHTWCLKDDYRGGRKRNFVSDALIYNKLCAGDCDADIAAADLVETNRYTGACTTIVQDTGMSMILIRPAMVRVAIATENVDVLMKGCRSKTK